MPQSPPAVLPLPDLQRLQRDALLRLLAAAGNAAHLARMLDVHYMTVRGWEERERISKNGARLVERHPVLGEEFSATELRPDLQERS